MRKSAQEIEEALNSDEPQMRMVVAQSCIGQMTPAQIEKGLTDPDEEVRVEFAKSMIYRPTASQIERGLTDESWLVRQAFAERTDYTATPEQIERGLEDSSPHVVMPFLEKAHTRILRSKLHLNMRDTAIAFSALLRQPGRVFVDGKEIYIAEDINQEQGYVKQIDMPIEIDEDGIAQRSIVYGKVTIWPYD